MKTRLGLIVLVMGILILGCLSEAQRGSGGTETGSTDPGNEDDGGSDETDETSGFHVKGQISAEGLALRVGDTQAFAVSDEVTDVFLANPATGDVACKTVEVGEDGTFDVEIPSRRFWSLFFANRRRSGHDMFLGRFRSMAMDALNPSKTEGELDLGTVTIDIASGEATSDQDHGTLLEGLGLDSDIAERFGEIDDLASRYSNPDMDDDGELDCGQTDHDFRLDYHVRYDLYENSKKVTTAGIIDRYPEEKDASTLYTMTGVYVGYPEDYSDADTGSVTFVDSDVTTSEAGFVAAGQKITSLTNNNYGNYKSFGPNIVDTSELPSGEIVYAFGEKELTFTKVLTPTLAEIKAPTGRIFPFIRFNKTSASCQSACTVSSISYKWLKKTETGWEAADEEELELLMDDDGGFISFYINNDSRRAPGFTIPNTSVSGEIEWTIDSEGATVSQSELDQVKTTQICHLGLSYDDKLGMRYFLGIDDAAGTCGK